MKVPRHKAKVANIPIPTGWQCGKLGWWSVGANLPPRRVSLASETLQPAGSLRWYHHRPGRGWQEIHIFSCLEIKPETPFLGNLRDCLNGCEMCFLEAEVMATSTRKVMVVRYPSHQMALGYGINSPARPILQRGLIWTLKVPQDINHISRLTKNLFIAHRRDE